MNRRELENENVQLKSQVAELTKKIEEALATAVKPISKGRTQAEQALALLKAGPVTMEQLAGINQKYPNDPIYFVRTLLKQEVKTHRVKGGKTTYSLPVAQVEAPAAPAAPAATEAAAPTPDVQPTEEEVTAAVEQVAAQAEQTEQPTAAE